MNAYRLLKEDSTRIKQAACGACDLIWNSVEDAERCCTCSYCRKPVEVRNTSHDECRRAHYAKIDRDRLDKAALEPFDPNAMYYVGDEYRTGEELLDETETDNEEVHCTTAHPVYLDAENVIENLTEQMWDDADEWDLNGVAELKAAIAAFNEANKTVLVYHVDFKRKAVVPRETTEAA